MSLLAFASGTHEVVGPFDSPAKNTFQAKSSGWDPFHISFSQLWKHHVEKPMGGRP